MLLAEFQLVRYDLPGYGSVYEISVLYPESLTQRQVVKAMTLMHFNNT